MTENEQQPPTQVAMTRKAATVREENKPPIERQRPRPPAGAARMSVRNQRKRHQQGTRTEASGGEDDGEPDSLVPDAVVAKELGTSVMGLWRRTNDPDDDFPPPIKIRSRNFRSRKALETYKARKFEEGFQAHKVRLDLRRREPV